MSAAIPENFPRLKEIVKLREYISRDKPKVLRSGFHIQGTPATRLDAQVCDYPDPAFFRPDLGLFVVPEEQFKRLS